MRRDRTLIVLFDATMIETGRRPSRALGGELTVVPRGTFSHGN